MRRLFTFEDAAEYLSMSKGFVEKEVREGRLSQMHLGRVRRIDKQELDRYIDERAVVETVGAVCHHDDSPTVSVRLNVAEKIGGVL